MDSHIDAIDAAVFSSDYFHDADRRNGLRQAMARWERGLKEIDEIFTTSYYTAFTSPAKLRDQFPRSKPMNYPTKDEVEKADHYTVCLWYRELHSPGAKAVGTKEFAEVMESEFSIMELIVEKVKGYGGFTPEISKRIARRHDPV